MKTPLLLACVCACGAALASALPQLAPAPFARQSAPAQAAPQPAAGPSAVALSEAAAPAPEAEAQGGEAVRAKRSGSGSGSGSILGLVAEKVTNKLGALATASSGRSSYDHDIEYPPPTSYGHKSFDLWGFKKALLGTLLQAVKAIKGGLIALKGQLIKAKGHILTTKGALFKAKGEALTDIGRHIATKALAPALTSSGHSSSGYGHGHGHVEVSGPGASVEVEWEGPEPPPFPPPGPPSKPHHPEESPFDFSKLFAGFSFPFGAGHGPGDSEEEDHDVEYVLEGPQDTGSLSDHDEGYGGYGSGNHGNYGEQGHGHGKPIVEDQHDDYNGHGSGEQHHGHHGQYDDGYTQDQNQGYNGEYHGHQGTHHGEHHGEHHEGHHGEHGEYNGEHNEEHGEHHGGYQEHQTVDSEENHGEHYGLHHPAIQQVYYTHGTGHDPSTNNGHGLGTYLVHVPNQDTGHYAGHVPAHDPVHLGHGYIQNNDHSGHGINNQHDYVILNQGHVANEHGHVGGQGHGVHLDHPLAVNFNYGHALGLGGGHHPALNVGNNGLHEPVKNGQELGHNLNNILSQNFNQIVGQHLHQNENDNSLYQVYINHENRPNEQGGDHGYTSHTHQNVPNTQTHEGYPPSIHPAPPNVQLHAQPDHDPYYPPNDTSQNGYLPYSGEDQSHLHSNPHGGLPDNTQTEEEQDDVNDMSDYFSGHNPGHGSEDNFKNVPGHSLDHSLDTMIQQSVEVHSSSYSSTSSPHMSDYFANEGASSEKSNFERDQSDKGDDVRNSHSNSSNSSNHFVRPPVPHASVMVLTKAVAASEAKTLIPGLGSKPRINLEVGLPDYPLHLKANEVEDTPLGPDEFVAAEEKSPPLEEGEEEDEQEVQGPPARVPGTHGHEFGRGVGYASYASLLAPSAGQSSGPGAAFQSAPGYLPVGPSAYYGPPPLMHAHYSLPLSYGPPHHHFTHRSHSSGASAPSAPSGTAAPAKPAPALKLPDDVHAGLLILKPLSSSHGAASGRSAQSLLGQHSEPLVAAVRAPAAAAAAAAAGAAAVAASLPAAASDAQVTVQKALDFEAPLGFASYFHGF